MNRLRLGVSGAILGTALALSACGNNEPAPVSDTDAVDVAETTEAPPRASKEEILTRFEGALENARASSGPGAPVMWTLSDEDTVINIFGTVHLLRPDLVWRTDALNQAIESADTIVFEVDMKSEEAQRAIATDFLARGMYQDGRTLKEVLNDEDEAVISAAFDSIGVPLDAMNTFEPWMASVNLGVMKLVADGYDPNSGVETVIEAEGSAAGKSFAYLETISQQADAFDLLAEDDQVQLLYESALLLDETPRMLDLLVDEWADGDVAGIGSLMADPDGYGFTDEAYERLIVTRNEAWIPVIEEMLDQPGSILIAAGAGHFAGPDSVITMLRAKGYEVEGP